MTARIPFVTDEPGRRRIAVESHGRSVLGPIGELGAVTSGDRLDRFLSNDGFVGTERGERQSLVVHVDDRDDPGFGFGGTPHFLRAAPVMGATTRRVGHDDRSGFESEITVVGCRVENDGATIHESGGGDVDESGSIGPHPLRSLGHARTGGAVVDGPERDLGQSVRGSEYVVGGPEPIGTIDRRFAEIGQTREARWIVAEKKRCPFGANRAEALVFVGVDDHDRVGSEESRHRRHGCRIDGAVLERVVECVERVHVRSASERQPVATHESLLRESRQDRIDRISPPIRR